MPAIPPSAAEHVDRRAVMRAGAVALGVGTLGAATLSGCGGDPVEVGSDAAAAAASDSPTSSDTGAPASPTGSPSPAAARASTPSRSATTGEDDEDDASTGTSKSSKPSSKATPKSTKPTTKPSTKPSSKKPAQPIDVPLSEIPVGGAIVRNIKGRPIVLSRTGSNSVVGFDARCTHQGCPVESGGGRLECPCHGSAFDLRSGGVLNGPASSPLKRVSVTVHDGGVSLA